jgi:hypothetical protein
VRLPRLIGEGVAILGPLLICVLGLAWPDDLAHPLDHGLQPRVMLFIGATAVVVSIAAYWIWDRHVDEAQKGRLEAFGTRVLRASTKIGSAFDALRAKDPAAPIRMILWAIVDATRKSYGDGNEFIYGCNVMVFQTTRPSDVRFASAKEALGYLVLSQALSTTLPGECGAPDTNLGEFALPVCALSECLPGAPIAFKENRPRFYAQFDELVSWARKRKLSSADEIARYFEDNGALIVSMLAVPVCSNGQPIAVINLHRNRRKLLRRDSEVLAFVEKLEPLTELLTDEVARLP